MTRRAPLYLMFLIVLIAFTVPIYARAQETTPSVQTAPVNSTAQWTLYSVIALAIGNISLWLSQLVAAAKERRAAAEAEEAEAEAKAEAKAPMILSFDTSQLEKLNNHETRLGRHDVEIDALKRSSTKFDEQNRQDHQQLFNENKALQKLILERLPMPTQKAQG